MLTPALAFISSGVGYGEYIKIKPTPLLVMSHYSVAEVSTRLSGTLLFDATSHYRLLLLRYFWRPTRRVAGKKQEFETNAVLAAGLSGFNAHRRGNSLP